MSVFDEIDRLQDSELSTWQALVENAGTEDVNALGEMASRRSLGVDNWSGINVMCSQCSHGSPDSGHEHRPVAEGTTSLGLAGSEDEIAQCLEEWAGAGREVRVTSVEFLW